MVKSYKGEEPCRRGDIVDENGKKKVLRQNMCLSAQQTNAAMVITAPICVPYDSILIDQCAEGGLYKGTKTMGLICFDKF